MDWFLKIGSPAEDSSNAMPHLPAILLFALSKAEHSDFKCTFCEFTPILIRLLCFVQCAKMFGL
jgi:hypothetical protein